MEGELIEVGVVPDTVSVTAPPDAVSRDDMIMLAAVIEEIVGILAGCGATLTLHDGGSFPPVTLYRSPGLADDKHKALLETSHGLRANLPSGELAWHLAADGATAVVIPVERVAGHSRLIITVVAEQSDAEHRDRAERIYRDRRPFAIGYFRFWQLNRLNMRRYQALEAALDCTDIGIVLVDRDSHILFANRAADEILAAGQGLGKHQDSLRATNLGDSVNLSAALSHVVTGDGCANATVKAPLLAFRRKGTTSLVATIVPARIQPIEPRDVAATVYIVDPSLNIVKSLAPLCQLYGLSPMETRLVCHLAAGEPISDAAAKMRIKEQTARSYLKQIFIKTDTNRQTALVALMLSSLMRIKSDVLQEALTEGAAAQALSRYG
jgi:DNA-binding CsgD family transcriptional regulator/PAS domain-containing protein